MSSQPRGPHDQKNHNEPTAQRAAHLDKETPPAMVAAAKARVQQWGKQTLRILQNPYIAVWLFSRPVTVWKRSSEREMEGEQVMGALGTRSGMRIGG
ncbi:hypothetical protein B7463_g7587, partial [Scytalidium lignicola]